MMILTNLSKQLQELVAEHSASILTGTAVVGVVTTAVLTARGAIKANELIHDATCVEKDQWPTNKEKFVIAAPHYAPAVASGLATIAAVLFSHRISSTKSAALAAAYGVSERAFSEYKEKVLEHFGEKKDRMIKDEVAKEQLEKNPPPDSTVFIVAEGDVLCYDAFTGRYFRSGMERIRKAVNDINEDIAHHMYASLGDFYERIGLSQTDITETLGWTTLNRLEIDYSTQMTADQRPCIVITFQNPPKPKFDDIGY